MPLSSLLSTDAALLLFPLPCPYPRVVVSAALVTLLDVDVVSGGTTRLRRCGVTRLR